MTVLTTPHRGAAEFDRQQAFRIERWTSPVLLPDAGLARAVRRLAAASGARLVLLDPALPIGLLGQAARACRTASCFTAPRWRSPAGSRSPAQLLRSVLTGASLVDRRRRLPGGRGARAAAGRRMPPVVIVPPGVDHDRFRPLGPRNRWRPDAGLGFPTEGRLVVSVSRLVPRKGMDVLIEAVARLSAARART